MAENEKEMVQRMAKSHSVSPAAVQVVLTALRSGGGRMAQFSHADFGGMCDEGIIGAWGIGVNTPLPILKVMEDADPDVCLCARQYSLIDHASAVQELFPTVRKKNVSLVIGSSLNAGFISGSPRYNYGKENFKIPAAAIEKRRSSVPLRPGTASIYAQPRFSSRRRRTSQSLWSWALTARSRFRKTGIRCKPRSLLISLHRVLL